MCDSLGRHIPENCIRFDDDHGIDNVDVSANLIIQYEPPSAPPSEDEEGVDRSEIIDMVEEGLGRRQDTGCQAYHDWQIAKGQKRPKAPDEGNLDHEYAKLEKCR